MPLINYFTKYLLVAHLT